MILNPIDCAEALRYMGGADSNPSEVVAQTLTICEKKMRQMAQPRYVYKILPIRRTDSGDFVGCVPLIGEEIRNHLEGCDRAILMAATLSGSADLLIQRAERQDLMQSVTLDALAGAAIEQVCNRAEQEIQGKYTDCYFTWRFSPGYGDYPITVQPYFLQELNAQRQIGLTVSENYIMMPRKSVTAIIGISNHPIPKKRKGCGACKMHDRCAYREKGGHCS